MKLGATEQQIATYETFLWLTGMFTFFWIAGTINAMLSVQKNFNQQEVFANTALAILWQSVIAVQLLVVFQFVNNGNPILTAMAAGYVLFNTVAFLNEYIYFLKDEKKSLLTYGLSSTGIQILLTVIPFVISGEILWSLAGLAILGIAKLFWLVVMLRKHATFSFNKPFLSSLIKLSIPASTTILVSGSAEYIDGFLVKKYFDEKSFALFRYGARELPLALILANTLSTAMIAPIANDISAGLDKLKQQSAKLSMLLFPISIVLMLTSKMLFVTFYNDTYLLSASIFNILLLLVIPRLVFPQTVFTALRMNTTTLTVSLVEIAINIVASITLMQYYGLMGIAYGTLLAFVIDKTLLVFLLYRKHHIAPGQYINLPLFFAGSCSLLAAYFISLKI